MFCFWILKKHQTLKKEFHFCCWQKAYSKTTSPPQQTFTIWQGLHFGRFLLGVTIWPMTIENHYWNQSLGRVHNSMFHTAPTHIMVLLILILKEEAFFCLYTLIMLVLPPKDGETRTTSWRSKLYIKKHLCITVLNL